MANKVARQAEEQLRKTKIICTIGPATASFQKIKALRNAGMDLVRLNMSHSSHAEAKKVIDWVNKLNQTGDSPVSVLLDTQGPEIRTGELKNPMKLKTGQIVSLTVRDAELVETQSIVVDYLLQTTPGLSSGRKCQRVLSCQRVPSGLQISCG